MPMEPALCTTALTTPSTRTTTEATTPATTQAPTTPPSSKSAPVSHPPPFFATPLFVPAASSKEHAATPPRPPASFITPKPVDPAARCIDELARVKTTNQFIHAPSQTCQPSARATNMFKPVKQARPHWPATAAVLTTPTFEETATTSATASAAATTKSTWEDKSTPTTTPPHATIAAPAAEFVGRVTREDSRPKSAKRTITAATPSTPTSTPPAVAAAVTHVPAAASITTTTPMCIRVHKQSAPHGFTFVEFTAATTAMPAQNLKQSTSTKSKLEEQELTVTNISKHAPIEHPPCSI
ncbi:hypothetical protein H0H81_006919 [Sphagnurus paluster]|uniref:Uncharacterized protein n=1 Tax=Sphagnurus paluster TaxID=117069 RepID=A0A9P7FQE7_9AGAR|nr:hypothetical protein H0H81_006919 [Sphagnurus paluster]